MDMGITGPVMVFSVMMVFVFSAEMSCKGVLPHGLGDDPAFLNFKNGKIRAAALDVYKSEPPKDSKLLGLDNAITVCHLGANTDEAQINAGTVVVEKIKKILTE